MKAILGTLYIAPTSALVGGTELQGMQQGAAITIVQDPGVKYERHGLEADAVRAYRDPAPAPPYLVIPAQGGDATTLKLLWAHLTSNGTQIASGGSYHVPGAHTMREYSAIIRPWDTTQRYWYFPRLQLHDTARPLMNRDRIIRELAESNLILLCARLDNSDYPAIGYGTAAEIDSLFGLGAPPPP